MTVEKDDGGGRAANADCYAELASPTTAPDGVSLDRPARTEAVDAGIDGGKSWLLAAGLAGLLCAAIIAEVALLLDPSVPVWLDKAYFTTALVFQVAMAATFPMALFPTLERCRSWLLDVCHWAFVVMVFGGAAVLRATGSLLFVAALAATSLALRISMRHNCIITSVARRSSLPNISGRQVTCFFWTLLIVTTLRLCLIGLFGEGFPVTQIMRSMGLLGAAKQEAVSAAIAGSSLSNVATEAQAAGWLAQPPSAAITAAANSAAGFLASGRHGTSVEASGVLQSVGDLAAAAGSANDRPVAAANVA